MNIESSSGNEHELEVEFEYSIGSDGIGPYEYWGMKGYDEGTNYIEDVVITGIEVIHSFPKRDKSGNPILSNDGSQLFKDVYRKIDLEKLECINLEDIEKRIREDFDFEGEEDDYYERDYFEYDD